MTFREAMIPKADHCPICGEVHAAIPSDEACPTHGHRLSPRAVAWGKLARWRLECPTRGCGEGRWLE